jgi:hypothetical protein
MSIYKEYNPNLHGRESESLNLYIFWCPGCKEAHAYYVWKINTPKPSWNFNGDFLCPTFTPSLLINKDLTCPNQPRCHLNLTDGYITYHADCTHKLAGQTIYMVNMPYTELGND